MAEAQITLYLEIELSDNTKLPLDFKAYIISEECSSVSNPFCILLYEGKKVILEREKIKKIEYIIRKGGVE